VAAAEGFFFFFLFYSHLNEFQIPKYEIAQGPIPFSFRLTLLVVPLRLHRRHHHSHGLLCHPRAIKRSDEKESI
jgi:hypothetical protein